MTSGENFAALAKKFSEDPSSKKQGGKLPISKGRQVPEFDKAAFALDAGEISRPVKTTYGWHIITALTAIKKQKTTPLSEVRPAIRQQLLQQEKTDAMKEWVEDTQKELRGEDDLPGRLRAAGVDQRHLHHEVVGPLRRAPRPPGADRAPAARLPLGP